MYKVLVNHLDISLPRKNVVRLTDHLDMTIVMTGTLNHKTNKLFRLIVHCVQLQWHFTVSYHLLAQPEATTSTGAPVKILKGWTP